MNQAPSRWKETYNVKVYETDALGRANLTSLCNYFQDTAWKHFREIDRRGGPMLEQNDIWILARMEIRIDRMPKWEDNITIETWPPKMERLFAFRDFRISDESGNCMASGSTSWAVINMPTRKIRRLTGMAEKWPEFPAERAIGKDPEKVSEPVWGERSPFFEVKYSDLDVNRHVNNVKYIEWMYDIFSMEFLETNEIKKAEINFIDEAQFGDCVSGTSAADSPGVYINNIVRKSDGKEVSRARFSFKTIEKKGP
jgi:medium-chain acyl-[acyl-carrier-protein] hydrolase